MNTDYHIPVLLQEATQWLITDKSGIYIDVTFGGGGHSEAILQNLHLQGRLFAFDQDPDTLPNVQRLQRKYENFTFIPNNFRYLKQELQKRGITQVTGILADLGVSSHQFDTAERGFSFRFDAPLDMRMNKNQSLTAQSVLQEYSEKELHRILGMYGEIRNAKTLANSIVTFRKKQKIQNTADLLKAIEKCLPFQERNKYLAQVFQALRIEVNDELQALQEMLVQTAQILAPKGRLVVLSYHSLEDRLVKNFIQKGKFWGEVEKDFYGNPLKPLQMLGKAILPTEQEVQQNPRARSAKMRVAEKL
ncbi:MULTISPECIES: 16S rRNA (cytosine(1402)-N(4))-methyltransferase RsmH [Raineya]|uniref:Ribosomal RNA small subunit methyltransferase H n=1 Tax=Raineya orbicola TaxID=2016530 RepID=A0A2N3IK28_9BACT|nr:16S rRNA (cytosine(1402)-N(4))-methyltransferase RsmH [Raineya orbicola]PKQ70608.1 16S rRNA (cytosine(1402)-N(4))-methyltransferase [Raineya orbicola]